MLYSTLDLGNRVLANTVLVVSRNLSTIAPINDSRDKIVMMIDDVSCFGVVVTAQEVIRQRTLQSPLLKGLIR